MEKVKNIYKNHFSKVLATLLVIVVSSVVLSEYYTDERFSYADTTSKLVVASSDDAEEIQGGGSDGNMDLTNNDLRFGRVGSRRHIGMRFTSVTIPSGAIINDAYIEFRATATDSGWFQGDFYGDDTATPATFTTTNGDITSRTQTTASVSGDSADFGNWTNGNDYDSPDLTTIIQELVDSYDYSSGGDIAILWIYNTGNGERIARSYDGSSTNAPELFIDYTDNNAAPEFTSITALDTDCGDEALTANDQLTLLFDIATNAPAAGTKAEIDGLINWGGKSIGTAYTGAWSTTTNANDTLKISISNASGGNLAIGDTITIKADGTEDLKNAAETSPASTDSDTVGGDWGHPLLGNDDSSSARIGRIDKSNADLTLLGNVSIPSYGLAQRYSDGLVFVLEEGDSPNNDLVSFDIATQTETSIGTVTGTNTMPRLAFDGSDVLWGMDTNNVLFNINTTTAAPTIICNPVTGGGLTTNGGGDFAFDTDGTLYMLSSNNLYTLNTTTCTASLIGATGVTNLAALAFDQSGNLYAGRYGSGTEQLYSINKSTGAATLIAGYTPSENLYDFASCPIPAGTPDLSTSTKTENDGDNAVMPGDTITYTITIKNTGSVDGTGIDVDDTIDPGFGNPGNFTFTNCGTYTNNSAANVDIDGVDVTTANDCVITYDVTVDNPYTGDGTIDNSCTISAASEGGSGAGPISADTLTVDTTPNLSTSTKDDDVGATVQPGDTVTYTITIINSGNGNATDVDVDDTVSSNLENVNVTGLTNCGTYTDNSAGNTIDIDDVDIAVGTNCVITFTADVKSPLDEGTTIPNQATISAASEGGVGGTPSSPTLTVDATPNLGVTKVEDDADNIVDPGQTDITYTITITNTGDGTATGVDVDDTIDADLGAPDAFTFTNCGSAYTNNSAANVDIDDVEIAVGVDCVITYEVDVDGGATGGATIDNSCDVGVSDEGGNDPGIVQATTLTVSGTPNLSTSTKVEDDADNTVIPGQTVTYTITIKNTGNATGTGIDVDDTIDPGFGNPGNFTFLNCGGAFSNNSLANVDIDDLQVTTANDCVITYDVTVDDPYVGDFSIDNSCTISAADEGGSGAGPLAASTLTVDTTPDLSTSTKDDDVGATVQPGDTVTYTITLINSGDGDATDVDVDDTVSSNLENVNVTGLTNCGTYTDNSAGNTIDIDDVDIAVGTNCVITFTADVKSPLDEGTNISNSATISSAIEGGPGGNPSSPTLTVDATPNLGVTKVEDDVDNNVDPNQTVTYTITISNTGDGTATGVDVYDTIDSDFGAPGNFTFTNCGSAYTNNSAGDVDIDDVEISTTANCVITYDVVVDAGASGGSTIDNSCDVGVADEGGNDPGVVQAATLTVTGTPDLSTSTKDDNVGATVQPGDTVTYTITIKNTGNGTGTGIDVDDTLDPDLENINVVSLTNCGTYTDNSAGNTLDIDGVDVAVGTDCVIVYDADVKSSAVEGATIPNQVTICAAVEGGSGATPSSPTLTVDITPNLIVDKAEDDLDDIVDPGQTDITYTITISNSGDGDATGVDVDDTIDADLGAPDNFTFTNCGSAYTNNSAANVDIDDLEIDVGVNCIITYDVDVDGGATGGATIDNSCDVGQADEGGNDPGVVQATTLTVKTIPNLSGSTKDDDVGATVAPGDTVTYTITIENSGNGTGTGIDVDDTLDPDLENINVVSLTNCGTYTDNSAGNTLDIDGVDVAVGTDCVIVYDADVKASAVEGATIPNQVTISAATEGGSGATPSSPTLTVDITPNLSTSTKDDDVGATVAPGDTVTYTITIKNTGNGTGTGIDVDDTLDPDLENINVVSLTNCGTYTDNSAGNTFDIDGVDVAVGTDCVIVYDADVKASAVEGATIPNQVTISAATEGGPGATPSSPTLTVDITPDLSTSTKDDNVGATVAPGDTVTYTVTIVNTGDGTGTGIDVDDTLDPDLENINVVSLTNCGTYTDNSAGNTLDIDGVDVAVGTDCVIVYDADVKASAVEGATIPNQVTISAATEGGSGATPSSPTLTVDVTPNLGVTKTEDDFDDIVDPGQTDITYTITISNTGDGTATGVDVDDTIDADLGAPDAFTFTNCGSAYTNNSAANVDIDDVEIAVGVDCVITYEVDVDAGATGGNTIDNSCDVGVADEGGNDPAPVQATTLTINSIPNLSSSSKVEDDINNIVTPGQTVTYTITLENTGNATGTGITVTDTIDTDFGAPGNFSYSNCGGAVGQVFAAPTLTFSNITVTTSNDCIIDYDVVVDNPLNEGTTLTNSCNVSAASEGGSGAGPLTADTLTVDATPDLSTSTKDDDVGATVAPGDPVTYTITIINNGDGNATDVDVDDTVSSNLENVNVTGLTNCGTYTDNSAGNTIDIDDVDIAVGTNCVITFTADVKTPLDEGTTIPNSATISAATEGGFGGNPSSPTLTVDATPDLSVDKTEDDFDDIVDPGQTDITYTITISNSGDGKATGVDVDDTIDANLGAPDAFTFTNCGVAYTNNSAANVDIDDVEIAVGVDCVITYEVDVDGGAAGGATIDNSCDVGVADEGGNDPAPVQATTLTVNTVPNLGVTKTEDDADNNVDPGQTDITYTITITNTGNGTATGVDVDDTIDADLGAPDAFTFTNCGVAYTNNSAANVDIDDLQVTTANSCIITYEVDVDGGALGGATIDNSCDASQADEGGNDPAPVQATTLTVNTVPNLGVTKTEDDVDNNVDPGQTDITYTITITNTGNGTATGVDVDDTIDADLGAPDAFTFTNCGVAYTNNSAANVDIDDLQVTTANSCIITYEVDVDGGAAGGATIDNSCDVGVADEGGNDPAPVQATTLTVNTVPNLGVTKTEDDADNNVDPGQTDITYTITITNTGNGTATGVDVDDTIDADLGAPDAFTFTNCGVAYTNNSAANVDIDDLQVTTANSCIITYEVDVDGGAAGGATIDNSCDASQADEGGNDPAPVQATTLTVNTIPNLSGSTKDDDVGATVAPGDTVTYTITIENSGNGTGTGIDVDDTLDPDLENINVISLTNCGTYTDNSAGNTLDIDGVDVAVGTDCVIIYDADVKASAVEGATIPNEVTISAATEGGSGATPSSPTLTVDITPNLSVDKAEDDFDNIVDPGQNDITYTITISNTGDGTATGVDVDDTIDADLGAPDAFTFTNCGVAYTNNSAANVDIDDLQVTTANSCIITYEVDVDGGAAGGATIDNSCDVGQADEGGNDPAPVQATTLTVNTVPNLGVTKTEDDVDNNVDPGQTDITYTITITNTGNGTATGVDVDDTIDSDFGAPDNFTFTNCGSAYTNNSAANVDIDDLEIDVGVNCIITYDVDVDGGATGGATIDNSCDVGQADEGGNDPGAVQATTLTVNTIPNLSTSTKVEDDINDIVTPGQTVTYTITLKNTGNGTGTGISVTDTIDTDYGAPGNFNYTNCGGAVGQVFAAPTLTFSNISVTTANDCVIDYDVVVDSPLNEGTTLTNSCNVSPASEGGSGAGPITATTLTVDATPNLGVTKTEDDADNIVDAGQTDITYTITISNSGDGDATGVDVDDTIDADLGAPDNFTFTNCGVAYTNNSAANVDIDDLEIAVGVNCVITYEVDVDPGALGGATIDNSCDVGVADEGGNDPAPVQATTLTVNTIPNLSTSTKDDNVGATVAPGDTVTYTITIKNTGNGTGTGIDVDDTLDPDLENINVINLTNCGTYTDNSAGNTLDIDGVDVTIANDCVIVYDADVKASAVEGATIPNQVNISAATEGGPGATPSSPTLTVDVTPNLGVTKTEDDVDDFVDPSQTVTYTITISNTGDGTATGVDVDDTIDSDFGAPGNFTFTNCGGAYTNNSAADVDIDDLQVTTSNNCVITYDVDVDPGALGGATIDNSCDVGVSDEGGNDPAPVAATTLTVNTIPNLGVTKTDDDTDNLVLPGQTVTYTITINNTGNGTGTLISATDTIDADFGAPYNFTDANCGGHVGQAFAAPTLTLSNISVTTANNCVITYDVDVNLGALDGATIDNSCDVSAASEGGNDPAPVNADTLTVSPDSDGDTIQDIIDIDDDNDGIPDVVEGGGDSDGDGIVDRLDLDSDNDGIVDAVEANNGTLPPNMDNNGQYPPAYAIPNDADNDGLVDDVDPDQGGTALPVPDLDIDGFPDFQDIDADYDGIVDNIEAQVEGAYVAPTGVDTDLDGIDDAYDPDAIGGVPLVTPADTDGDTFPDYQDIDSDNDNAIDVIEGSDANIDGIADVVPSGVDTDGDGLDDVYDTVPGPAPGNEIGSNTPLQDTDADTTRDWRDTDDDDDTLTTLFEDLNGNGNPGDEDTDGDGIPNYLDLDDDDDGTPTKDEDPNNNGDLTDDDSDCDGTVDYLDPIDDNLCPVPGPGPTPGPGPGGSSGVGIPTHDAPDIPDTPDPEDLIECLEYDEDRMRTFVDLLSNQWYTEYFEFLKKIKIADIEIDQYVLSGYDSFEGGEGDAIIGAENNVIRLEAVKMALTSNCIPIYQELPLEGPVFSDLPRISYPEDETMDFITRVMYTAFDWGIIDGYSEDVSARPLREATRAEVLKIFLNAGEIMDKYKPAPEEQIFLDVRPGDWYYEYVQFAGVNNIASVDNGRNFSPNIPAVRADVAALDTRIMTLTDNVDEFIKDLIEELGLIISNGIH